MRNRPDAVMLFAAGFGTRMRGLTRCRPKPLLEVAGRSLLDHALDVVDAAGVTRKVVNTHYLAEQIEAHLADREDIAISREVSKILETGGGLRNALPLLGPDPVFTLNTDYAWTGRNPLIQLAETWDPARMDGLVLTVAPHAARGHFGRGDFQHDEGGPIRRGPANIYTGAQILKTDDLWDIKDDSFSLNQLWDRMLARGRLFGISHDGMWCDVGRPEGIELAETMLAEVANG
ncbi:MurNAc alpha-1-phosphate uridylyltransferase [Aliiruegeria haliotis]|uniref:MurNAc alpha-1-phosphate uridylyltransferase n=1 Tax=Aliiruegeria haliotis TaxID=1280846 RepID=A0A2T0RHS6_9RHOB|nr:nucleotidyltransferase family protein [Aliiruegeria haliotis]PRY20708.1 MurNAc alpha-1-phosphate uridylyltransferase [Aliiruegeria haliotis]